MRKVLLVIEDYHERTYLQTMLKKIGWDVIGLSNELGLGEQLLSFGPDVIFLSQNTRRTPGLSIARSIKKRNGNPKILLLGTQAPSKLELENAQVDLFLASPVNNRLLFEFLEKAGGFSAKVSMQKIRNMRNLREPSAESLTILKTNRDDLGNVFEGLVDEEPNKTEREKKYEEYLSQVELPEQKHFDGNRIGNEIKKIREKGYSKEELLLDQEKKEFVKALFNASKINKK